MSEWTPPNCGACHDSGRLSDGEYCGCDTGQAAKDAAYALLFDSAYDCTECYDTGRNMRGHFCKCMGKD